MWLKFFIYVQLFLLLAAIAGGYAGLSYWGQHLELTNANKALRAEIADKAIHLERLQNIQTILKTSDPEEIQSLFSTVSKERETNSRVVNLQDVFVAKDLQLAGVANLQLRSAQDDLRIHFELNNLSEGTLIGKISVYLILQDASVIEVQGEDNEMTFEIQRFRRVNSLLEIPSGVQMDSVFALRLVIENDANEELFIQTYPVSNIFTS